jgi:prepilin signal peptidase PulO-like enzyme (type II secretory pathway)
MIMDMYINQFIIYVSLILCGLCLGSFAGASMWRLRARQLQQDKAEGEEFDQAEYDKLKKLTKKSVSKDRSRCLDCNYTLKWYDLVPLVSWLSLKGKCRKCHKPIGRLEPLIELGLALFFVASYAFWPYSLNSGLEITRLVLWLLSGVGLAILFAYDAKWFILPNPINYTVIVIGFLNAAIVMLLSSDKVATLISIVVAALILSGLYLALNLFSRGKWVGFGDVKLGLGLALLLADWRLAFLSLFAANFIGCLVVLPSVIAGKLKRDSRVPFGPLLIIGFAIAGLFGAYLVDMYFYMFL